MPLADFLHVDEDQGLIFGWAVVSQFNDQPFFSDKGWFLPEAAVVKAAAAFMVGQRPALANHEGESIGTVVFSFPLTTAIAKALGITTTRTGLIVGLRPHDPQILRKFKTGELTGLSYNVSGTSMEVDE